MECDLSCGISPHILSKKFTSEGKEIFQRFHDNAATCLKQTFESEEDFRELISSIRFSAMKYEGCSILQNLLKTIFSDLKKVVFPI